MCPMEQREERAFDNMVKAIDMHETFEKVSINNHKSFLPHIALFKVCRQTALCDGLRDHVIPQGYPPRMPRMRLLRQTV